MQSSIGKLVASTKANREAVQQQRRNRDESRLRPMLGECYDEFDIKFADDDSGWARLRHPRHRPIIAMTQSGEYAVFRNGNHRTFSSLGDALLASERPTPPPRWSILDRLAYWFKWT